ncbi:SAM-dependent methyltransferase [Streptacidiphilus sp. N1-12]|uniref:SAM-dependent methyltransferase n=2 Tax=Streptacidiphilus alkalitolerans TaxID=3342712 RepID=A0ABV6VCG3_9ACTN
MTDQKWIPEGVDPERPSIARIYDFYLGGNHNLPADREAAREVIETMPELPEIMRINRAFLRRCVRYLVDSGIGNFLDLGSGIPTAGNVHEIAQAVDPTARIVYVDSDPVAVAHSQEILAGNDRALIVAADLRDAGAVLGNPEVDRLLLLGLGEPLAVLMSAVLHFVPDDAEAAALVAAYRDAMPSGSYLALSHASHRQERESAERVGRAAEQYSRTVAPMKLRSLEQVAELLQGFELVEPGIVYCTQWHPDPEDGEDPDPLPQICALARKP